MGFMCTHSGLYEYDEKCSACLRPHGSLFKVKSLIMFAEQSCLSSLVKVTSHLNMYIYIINILHVTLSCGIW